MANELDVADDLVDKGSLPEKLAWLGLAIFRFGVAATIAVLFFFALAILELRFQAENALRRADFSAEQNEAVQTQLHKLLSAQVGSPTDRAQASVTRREAQDFALAQAAVQERVALLGAQVTRLEREGRRLVSAAEQAGCGLEPAVSVARGCTNTTASAATTQTLAGELSDSQTAYDAAQTARRESERELRRLEVVYDDAVIKPGAALAAATPALNAFDQVQ